MLIKEDLPVLDYLLELLRSKELAQEKDLLGNFDSSKLKNFNYYIDIFILYKVGRLSFVRNNSCILHNNYTYNFKSFTHKYEEEQNIIHKKILEEESLKSNIETNKISAKTSKEANRLSKWGISISLLAIIVTVVIFFLTKTDNGIVNKLEKKIDSLEHLNSKKQTEFNDHLNSLEIKIDSLESHIINTSKK